VRTLAASTAIPVIAATPAKALLAPVCGAELVTSYNDCDQAPGLGERAGEQVLKSSKAVVERNRDGRIRNAAYLSLMYLMKSKTRT
jgi:hypothetical protein